LPTVTTVDGGMANLAALAVYLAAVACPLDYRPIKVISF